MATFPEHLTTAASASPRVDALSRAHRADRFFVQRWSLLALTGVVAAVFVALARMRPQIRVFGPGRTPIEATLELFAYDRAPNAPSPMPALGTARTDDDGHAWIDQDVGLDGCVCRVLAEGLGLGFGFISPSGASTPVELAPARRVGGLVLTDRGHPVEAALVQVFGGGPRGVLLTETVTDAGGGFAVVDISPTVLAWHFRVFAPGFALGAVDWDSDSEDAPVVRLETTEPARGRLVADGVLDLGGLAVRAYHVPGLGAHTDPDGRFSFDAAPPMPMVVYPVIDGLPDGWTCERTAMQSGREVTIRIVRERRLRGRVVDGFTGRPVVGARVFHENGPECVVATLSGDDGEFDLGLVPLGRIEVRAVVDGPRRIPGTRRQQLGLAQAMELVEVVAGAEPQPVLLRIE